MKIYLDVCSLCRLFDDQTSYRIRMETEAVIVILSRCMTDWKLIGSEVIEYEIEQMPDEERIEAIKNLLSFSDEKVLITTEIISRARVFHKLGIDSFDALHLASAESTGAVFLTTDDLLIKHINKDEGNIHIKVSNPLSWLMEETHGN
ncbi:putative nucleic acid-binding protein [Methanomicrobium sp. W14]|uniref:PIN domain-containing protein n=1 Tax=Methanomicrobium sp. W14 TaxID=2817839 RepID=UPI001AE7981D|nr:PIN domain-containing protein [Methanomicrobium sp. W14]MBP2134463.1 putative nucleic acid-binding protein [Methanomicrobium sp. W14]